VRSLLQDVQYSLRSLSRSPGFTSVVILTLGLGIGFNTAIYSVIHAFLLRPLPVHDPGQLVVLATRDKHTEVPHGLSFPDYRDYRALTVFSGMLARREFPVAANWKRDHQTERLWVDAVSINYFEVLGIGASQGRTFRPGEARQLVGVLDFACWREKFGGNPAVIGQSLRLDGSLVTVLGIAPEGFQGTQVSMRPDIYVPLEAPLAAAGVLERLEKRDAHDLRVIGRLAPGTTISRARAATGLLASQLQSHFPDTNKGVAVIAIPEPYARPEPQVSENVPAIAAFSMGSVALVLLIACANVANLLLVRATRRAREIALRTALGADRFRIVRLLLSESLILGTLGGATGFLVAHGAIRAIHSRPSSVDFPVHMDWSPDAQVLLFTTAIAILCGVLCGLMPALEISRASVSDTLKEGSGRSTGSRRRLTSFLVSAQVGVSMLLLIVAGLFIRGAQKAQESDLGFDRSHLQLLSVDLSKRDYDRTRATQFLERISDDVEVMPGVRGVSFARYIPFDMQGGEAVFSDEQGATKPSDALSVLSNTVGVDYFAVMGIPLLEGREFNKHDDGSAPRVAVINEALAMRLWPTRDALGRRIRLVSGEMLQVIGVVKTGKYAFLAEQPRPYLYIPFLQNYGSPTILHVRTSGTPANLVAALRQEIRTLDPDLPVFNVKTMEEHLQQGYPFSTIILGGALSGLFGLLGLALASIGLYGVVANTVNQRTREIGIRAALGASHTSILGLVLRQCLILVLGGSVVGLGAGLGVAHLLRRILFSVDPTNAGTFISVIAVLALVATVACVVPARKATKVDPMIALRSE